MVIKSMDSYMDDESKKIIIQILGMDPRLYYGSEILYEILLAAQSKDKGDYIEVTHGIHTNWEMMKKAGDIGQFTAFWFDVKGILKGNTITGYDGKPALHIYVGKFILATDYYGNTYWHRVNSEADDKTGYCPVYDKFNENIIIRWLPTGTVTDTHKMNEQIIMNGGKSKSKSMSGKSKVKELSIIPVTINIPTDEKNYNKTVSGFSNIAKQMKKFAKKLFKRKSKSSIKSIPRVL